MEENFKLIVHFTFCEVLISKETQLRNFLQQVKYTVNYELEKQMWTVVFKCLVDIFYGCCDLCNLIQE